MARVFYDCEFIEDGRTIDLISIGMVRESDGAELYLINCEAPYERIVHHTWLRQNVLPTLPMRWPLGREDNPGVWAWDDNHPDASSLATRIYITDRVHDFILDTDDPQLWAWYGAYDHVALAQLAGPMAHLPDGIPMWTNDLRQEAQRLGNPQLPEQPAGVHNALADARHNLVRAQALDKLAAPASARRCVASHCVENDHIYMAGDTER
ncbi:3'-5' exoribonuclease [Streptomyces sp. NBC_01216]|uniref:3'-5' exoribonuclease domain-containing protein n=1 Tax=Streptomyces sp. NBC_01216 TaxID=2903778 RepID=UPI002E0EF365|nr:3'-5' exoribonuclease [Streptomyces sp. NBC_01216]